MLKMEHSQTVYPLITLEKNHQTGPELLSAA